MEAVVGLLVMLFGVSHAPVSSVLVDFECLSMGEMRVSCSSEGGDSPQYSWTLDRHTLTDIELLSGNNQGNNITLKQHVSGHLNCSVRNNVSNAFKEKRISTCGFIFINCTSINGTEISGWVYEANNTLCIEPTTDPATNTPLNQTASTDNPCNINNTFLICGLRAAVVIFLLTGIFIYFAWKKKKNEKAGISAVEQTEYPENSVLMVEMRNSASYAKP